MSEQDVVPCGKCNAPIKEWENDWGGGHWDCPYEECDDKQCRALREPLSTTDLEAALEHWKHHGYLSGCSHGR